MASDQEDKISNPANRHIFKTLADIIEKETGAQNLIIYEVDENDIVWARFAKNLDITQSIFFNGAPPEVDKVINDAIREKEIQIIYTPSKDPRCSHNKIQMHQDKPFIVIPVFTSSKVKWLVAINDKDTMDKPEIIFHLTKNILKQDENMSDELINLSNELQTLKEGQNTLRAMRMAALSSLTLGVSHEIRNPLAVLRSGLELLKSKPRTKKFLIDFHEKYSKYIDRIEEVVQKINDLSNEEVKKRDSRVNLNALIKKSLDQLDLNDHIILIKELNPVSDINGIESDLEKAFLNIARNAIEAMPNGGTLAVVTNEVQGKIIIKISDSGTGIAKENIEKIYDPFWSTRHSSTGLGLTIAYRIIKEHAGDISVKSKVGSGTTFTITLNSQKG
jgi:signal transduction histidine kinase